MILCYLSVLVGEKTHVFGDNKASISSFMRPHLQLHKRHTALSFHYVKKEIASRIVSLVHIDNKIESADMLNKYWDIKGFGQCISHSVSMKVIPWILLMQQQFQQMGSDKVLTLWSARIHEENLIFFVLL